MKVTLRTAQEGIAHLMLIVVVVVLAGIGGVGYYVWNNQKTNKVVSNLSQEAKELNSACKEAYDDDDFCAFASSWDFEGQQKMTITSPEDGTVVLYERDSSGNTRMVTTQGGTEVGAFINIGNVSYVKNTDENNWTKYESTSTETDDSTLDFEEDFSFDDEDFSKDTSTITKQGKEACGNLTCFKYLMTDSTAPGEETTIWFDDADYKLRRMSLKNSDGTSDITFEYEVAAITEPSPVVEMPDYDSMTAEELQQLMEQYAQ